MSEIIRTSFYYDPVRQGYDTNSWMTLSGAPISSAGRLVIDNVVGIAGAAIHYGDFLKGDISFNVNVPTAPAAGISRYIGVAAPGLGAYIRFAVGTTLACQTSDGITTTTSSDLTWDDVNWNGVNIVFRIRWEAGTAKFFINGSQVYAVSDDSVPAGPLSLYLFDNSTSAMSVGDIIVRGTQSFVMNPKSDGTSTNSDGTLSMFEAITNTENIALLIPSLKLPFVSGGLFESIAVTENFSAFVTELFDSLNDSVTVTENFDFTIQ